MFVLVVTWLCVPSGDVVGATLLSRSWIVSRVPSGWPPLFVFPLWFLLPFHSRLVDLLFLRLAGHCLGGAFDLRTCFSFLINSVCRRGCQSPLSVTGRRPASRPLGGRGSRFYTGEYGGYSIIDLFHPPPEKSAKKWVKVWVGTGGWYGGMVR